MASYAAKCDEPAQRVARPKRQWLFRIGAVLVGLSPFLAFEGVCVLMDWGRPSLHDDPFVGFRSVVPLFVPDEDEARYEIPKSRQAYFRPQSFAAHKPAGAYRIFCLGGSTVQGRPFAVETSFTTWLGIALDAAEPSRDWEVVNCGGVSYASYRLVPVLEEVLGYEPDLIILYTGHNEFLESRTFDHIADRGRVLNASLEAASRLRTFTLLRAGYLRLRGKSPAEAPQARPILPTEVDALLDYRGGLEAYHRDDAWRRGVIAQYEYNLRRMIEMARDAGVEVMLVNPVSNLADSPPFKSEHRADLGPAERQRWKSLCEDARRHLHGKDRNLRKAAELFEQACRVDPLHAGTFYNLSKCYEAAGELDRAREAFLQAKQLDVCPLRILQPMNEAVLRIAHQTSTPVVDAQRLFAARSPGGIVGGQWLVDHVHPSIEGHQLLADALVESLVAQGTVLPSDGWQATKQQRYRRHFDSLGSAYFVRGTERLESVRAWAAGRARQVRGENDTSSREAADDGQPSDE